MTTKTKIDYSLLDEEILAEIGLAYLTNDFPEIKRLSEEAKEKSTYHPHVQQEIIIDEQGRKRFRENKLVRQLVDGACGVGAGNKGLNYVATLEASREDRAQLAQLIGYSVDGYQSLSYALPVEGLEEE